MYKTGTKPRTQKHLASDLVIIPEFLQRIQLTTHSVPSYHDNASI